MKIVKEIISSIRSPWYLAALFILHLSLGTIFLSATCRATTPQLEDEIEANGTSLLVVAGAILLGFIPAQILRHQPGDDSPDSEEGPLTGVWVKWVSYFSQNLFLILNVLPYLLLRDYWGLRPPSEDMQIVNWLIWLSALFIAAALAVSEIRPATVRTLLIFGIGLFIAIHPDIFAFPHRQDEDTFWTYISTFVVGAFLVLILVGVSASLRGSSSNGTALKRLTALYFVIVSWFFLWMTSRAHEIGPVIRLLIPVSLLFSVCAHEITLQPTEASKTNRAGGRPDWRRRLTRLLLSPGWPSAFLFTLAVVPIVFLVSFSATGSFARLHDWSLSFAALLLWTDAVLGSIILPAFVAHFYLTRYNAAFIVVLGYNLIVWMISCCVAGYASTGDPLLCHLLRAIPSIPTLYIANLTLARLGEYPQISMGAVVSINGLLLFLILGAFLWKGRTQFQTLASSPR